MRIIAGKYRSKKLLAPTGRTTRPTSDRAKEAVFNILEVHLKKNKMQILSKVVKKQNICYNQT